MNSNYQQNTTITIGNNGTTKQQTENNQQFTGSFEQNFSFIFDYLNTIKKRFNNTTTIFTPAVCGTIIILYIINLLFASSDNQNKLDRSSSFYLYKTESIVSSTLTLVPGNILAPNHWFWSCISMLTYPFVEYHWWQVLNDILVVSLCTTLIEPLWGRKDLVTFFFVVNTFVAFFTIVHYIMLYSINGDAKYLYNVRMYGLSGFCAAVCVTVKQILPESVLFSTSLGKFKNNNVPLCALLMSYFFYLINLIDGCLTLMFFYGLITSWFYLRFLQFHPSNGLRGDLSPSFDFCTFFPSAIKPYVASVCNIIYFFFVKINVFSPNSYRQYQNFKVLSERLSQEHSEAIISKHFKNHPSGNYQHLNQPKVELM